jgi:hypothetical protein
MGVTDDLPHPSIGLGKTDDRQGVVLVTFRHVNSHVLIKPVMPTDEIRHPSESLQNHVPILPHQKFVKLLGGISRRAVVTFLGVGQDRNERPNHPQGDQAD